jgi:hypothetical protein
MNRTLSIKLKAYDSSFLSKDCTGLGNNLFQLSFLIFMSKKFNFNYNSYYIYLFNQKVIKLGGYDSSKNIFRNIRLDKKNINFNNVFKEKSNQIFDNELVKNIKKSQGNVLIQKSNLQSVKYFNEFKDQIINLFSPDKNSLKYIYKKYSFLNNKNVIKISLNIRLTWANILSYKVNYYLDAISYIKKNIKNENVVIFVTSDNIKEAKNILKGTNENIIYSDNEKDYIDLWTSSLCDHNIICHSTLGWWCAYLNKNKSKIVTYPSDIFSFFYKKILKKDNLNEIKNNLYPDDWKKIESNSIYKK